MKQGKSSEHNHAFHTKQLHSLVRVYMLWFTAVLLYSRVLRVVGRHALCLFLVLCCVFHGGSHRSCGSAVGLGIVMGYAGAPTLPCASGGGWSRGCAQLGVPFGGPGRGWVVSGGCFSSVGAWVLCLGVWFGGPRRIRGGCWCAVRAAMPVAMPAWLVHPARLYGASGIRLGAGAHGCVLCWGVAGGALPVVVCCGSCFVHVCSSFQCACSVVTTCVQASLVLLLMPIVLYAWCYIVLLHSM